MTEREKIIEVIAPYVSAYGDDEAIADALIAAGLKFDRNISYTATFNLAQLERINDLERRLAVTYHRAEVAERQAMVLSKWLAEKTRKDYPWLAWFDAAQKQAEKELIACEKNYKKI